MSARRYRGRFAPSPTGPLHFGSLVAAVASYADARHHQGNWILRFDDIDEIRCQPESAASIERTLHQLGFRWDGSPVWQSQRKAIYADAIAELRQQGRVFPCGCSRKEIAAIARMGIDGPIYPGTCRDTPPSTAAPTAWRLRVPDIDMCFDDRVFGHLCQRLADDVGDFVVQRSDGFTAYQLAVVVDDQTDRITDVVRGADLLWSTPRQILLQRDLGYSAPRYLHLPLVFGQDGRKLSKSEDAHPVCTDRPVQTLYAAWRHLGQQVPVAVMRDPQAFWAEAIPLWDPRRIPTNRNLGNGGTNTL